MSTDSQLAVNTPRPLVKASAELSAFLGMEVPAMINTLKAQCFKNTHPDNVTDAQLAAFVSVANALKVNPLLPGFLYAYPTKNGGIEPIAGPDAIFKKLDEKISEGVIDGYDCVVYPEDVLLPPTHAVCIIERANGKKPAKYTALKGEWYVESNPNWKFKMRHMLWLRAIKQAARQVIHGLPMDSDEYKLMQMQNVTESGDATDMVQEPVVPRAPAPKRSAKGAAAVVENAKTQTEAERRAAEKGVQIQEAEIVQEKRTVTIAGETVAADSDAHRDASEEKKNADAQLAQLAAFMKAREAELKEAAGSKHVAAIESKLQTDAVTPEPKPAEPAPAKATALKLNEEVVATCLIKASSGLRAREKGMSDPKPSVLATLESEAFSGKVMFIDAPGATLEGDNVKIPPMWEAGQSVRVRVTGRPNANKDGPQAKVLEATAVAEVAEL